MTRILLAAPAAAETCRATVNDSVFLIDTEELDRPPEDAGTAERVSRWPGALKDRILGNPPACDGPTLISYLGARIPEDEIDGYCLADRETGGFLLVPGERNFRGRCATTACEKVDMAKDGAVGLAQDMTGLGKPEDEEEEEEKSVIEHVSGAVMLTGTATAVGSQLTALGSGAVAAVGALAAAAAAAATVVVVGGAVYVCS